MIGKLDQTLQFNSTALKLRAERQQLLSANIANADTPGYKAADFDFARALNSATGHASGAGASALRTLTSSAKHLSAGSTALGGAPILFRTPAQASLDGNSVEMDTERAQFADNAVRYEAALRFLNGQIKTMLSAIQG